MPIITEEQARAFHKENKAKMQGDFSTLKFQIMQYLLAAGTAKVDHWPTPSSYGRTRPSRFI